MSWSLSFRCVSSVRVMVAASLLGLAGVAEAQAVSGRALPLVFEQNDGQLAAGTAFAGRAPGYRLELRADELRFAMQGTQAERTISVGFAGSKGGKPEGIAEAGFRTNYYVGNDPKQWRTGVRNFDRVGLRGIYPGIDAEFYARDGAIEHDFLVAPGADVSLVKMKIAGAARMSVTAAGDVELAAEDGILRLKKPVAYQVMADGSRKSVDARFELKARGDLRFVLGAYDHARELVVDPVIVYASFAAGGSGSTAGSVASDTAGNVYLSGTTTSGKFGSVSPIVNCGSGSCPNNIFVLKFASGSNGVTPAWLTYIGEPGTGSMVVTSSVATTTKFYVGGYTNATALATAGATAVSNPTGGGYVGFVSGLSATAGTLSGTHLIYADAANPNINSVTGLALDSAGDLYLTGAIGVATTSGLVLTPTANAFAISPAVTAYGPQTTALPGNAYVAEYPVATPLSGSPVFFTYIQKNTLAAAIAVDANGLVYVAGETTGGFTAPPAPSAKSNSSGANDAFELNFEINPIITGPPPVVLPPTVTAFTWINGNASTTVAGLGIDGTGNSYLFGNTIANNLSTVLSPATCAVQCALPDAGGSGYAVELNSSGSAVAYSYLGGSNTADSVTGGTFGSGTAYVTGQTNSPKSGGTPFAATTTTQTATSPFNMKALAFGEDNTTTLVKRGYLASLAAGLMSSNYVANIGGSGGSDTAVGVAVDGSGNAYVAANIAVGSTPYVPAGAFQTATPAASGTSAYVAEVSASSALTGLTLAVATGSPSTDPLYYVSPTVYSTVTYTWKLTASANITTNNVVVGIAAQANLTYTSAQITDVTSGGTTVGSCSLGTNGVSCVIPAFPQTVAGTNDTLSVVLNASMNSTSYTVPGTISITATAASEASEYVTSTQTSNLSNSSNLVISMGTPSATSVYAASAGTGYTGILVTYPIKVTNSGTNAATASAATLSFTGAFPAGFTVTAVATAVSGGAVIGSCDTSTAATGCTSVNMPANAVLTYSITGYYSDTTLFAAGSTTPSVTSGTFSVAATGTAGNMASAPTLATGTTIKRAVDISAGTAKSSLVTYDGLNPANKLSTFNLSTSATPAPVNYAYTLVNGGPSIAYNVPLTASFPTVPGSGFVATGAAGTDSAGNPVVCTYATSLSCTVGEILPGGSVVVTLTATYPDQAPLADAVTAPAKSASYSLAGSAVAPTATYVAYGTGSTTATFASTAVLIERTAVLTVTTTKTTAVAPVCAGGNNACVYMYNASTNLNANANQYDTAVYNITVSNAGPNAATASTITIPLPTAPTTTGTTPTTHPLTVTAATATPSSTPAGWTGDVISSCTTAAGTVTCGSAATTGIPAGTSVAVALSGTFDSATVPVTAESVTTAAIPGTASVAASVFTTLPRAATLQTYQVARSSHLVIRKSRNSLVDVAPSTYKDLVDPDLDEKTTATTFGFDDEIEYEVAIGNGGVNDAPGVMVTDTLPPYFTVYKIFLIASTSLTPDTGANQTPVGTSVGTPTCTLGSGVSGIVFSLPYATGATTQQITCKAPAGYSLPADNSTTATPGTSGVELVYQGKFQNNFPAADDIPGPSLLYAVTSNVGDATDTTALATDYQAATDEMSAAVPPYNVQRIPIVPTIVIATIPGQTYGNPPVTVSATSPSTAAIVFAIVSGPATVSGSTVTLTGGGTVCVGASQVAAGVYAAGSAETCFTVAQEAQTISVTSIVSPVTYGIPPITLAATASSGLAVSYTYVSGPGSVSAGVLTVTGVGTITINANQAGNANYLAASQVQFQIVVTKASPVISWATPAAIGYGTALSATQLDAVVTGVGGSTLAGSSVYTPAAGAILPVGADTLTVTFTPANPADYTTATGIVTLIVGRGTPGITVTASPNPQFVQDAVTFTATLSSPGTAPSGTVNFVDGTTVIGSGTISSGVASFTTSVLASGSHSVTAVYTGDSNYGTATSTAVVEVVDDFSLSVNGTASQTVALSGKATYTLTVTPLGGATLPGAVNFTVSGLPAGATVAFTPGTLAAGAGTTNVTLTIVAPAQLAMLERRPGASRMSLALSGGFAALLLLPFSGRRRLRRLSRVVALGVLLLAAAMGVSGCGSGVTTTQSNTFTLTVNGTSGTLIHSATVTLVVQ